MSFRVLSWNINGLRSFKTEMKEFLSKLDADIICFQETKVTRDMLDEPLAIVDGYSSYFSFSRRRSGYSGVATFCTHAAAPSHAQEGLSGIFGGDLLDKGGTSEALTGHWTEEELKDLDSEGRAIITQHTVKGDDNKISMIAVINVYCPRVDPEKPERRVYKLRFYELLRQRAAAIRATGCHVVIVGDINTSHKQIDHCDPDECEDFEHRLERRYLDRFLIPLYKEKKETEDGISNTRKTNGAAVNDKLLHSASDVKTSKTQFTKDRLEKSLDTDKPEEDGFSDDYLLESASNFQVVDTFRYFYPQKQDAFTCWNTFTNARATNYGTRIDYIFCDEMLLPFVEDSVVLQDVMGSDHCPVAIKVKGEVTPSVKLPNTCTKYFPEFKGQQQKLSSYFQPSSSVPDVKDDSFGNNVHVGSKRKNIGTENKSSNNKKSCSEKQSKLNFYFAAKPKSSGNNTDAVKSEFDTNLKGSLSWSVNSGVERSSSENSSENLSQCNGSSSAESLDSLSSNGITVQEKTNITRETSGKPSISAKSSSWGFLMKGPKPPPLCPGHKEPTVVRTVKKKGPNMNKQFYACARGAGREGDPNAQCNFFQWLGKK